MAGAPYCLVVAATTLARLAVGPCRLTRCARFPALRAAGPNLANHEPKKKSSGGPFGEKGVGGPFGEKGAGGYWKKGLWSFLKRLCSFFVCHRLLH